MEAPRCFDHGSVNLPEGFSCTSGIQHLFSTKIPPPRNHLIMVPCNPLDSMLSHPHPHSQPFGWKSKLHDQQMGEANRLIYGTFSINFPARKIKKLFGSFSLAQL